MRKLLIALTIAGFAAATIAEKYSAPKFDPEKIRTLSWKRNQFGVGLFLAPNEAGGLLDSHL